MRLALAPALVPLLVAPALAQKGAGADTMPPGNPDPAAPVRAVSLEEFTEGRPNALELDGVGASILATPGDDGTTVPIFVVETLAGEVLRFEGEPSYFSFLPVRLEIAHLDASSPQPEVIATSYTGGAHCCDRLQIAAVQPDGTWTMTEFGLFDGGYHLDDANDDGEGEIVVADQSFLYTFDCYACSWAPSRYWVIRQGQAVDVSADPSYRAAYIAEIGDFAPEDNADRPGGLAGWAALQARLGDGEAALARIARIYPRNAETTPICTTGGPTETCAPEELQDMTFDQFLRFHLIEQGYLPASKGGGK